MYVDASGAEQGSRAPSHAGGVAVDGDVVYVTDRGRVFTYARSAILAAEPGAVVPQTAEPWKVRGGSYATVAGDRLYLGDFSDSRLHVYERAREGWIWTDEIATPKHSQGVIVRDVEFVFSSSWGRHTPGRLIAQHRRTGARRVLTKMPNLLQEIVEVDGEIIATYESGADEFVQPSRLPVRWLPVRRRRRSLWANPHMTRTPLSALGLQGP